jgi:glycosyltransferase involved in cell wall biosynthesis
LDNILNLKYKNTFLNFKTLNLGMRLSMKNNFASRLKMIGNGLPTWAQVAVKIPFLFLFAYDSFILFFDRRKTDSSFPCRSVSVIIPTRNEENNISACIQSVSGNRNVFEIIVVDAGSSDQTHMLAQQAGAHVIIHNKPIESGGGRGGQIKTGIHAARGDIVAIVHADTILPDFEIDRMLAELNHRPGVIGGSVGCRFDSPRRQYRILELANDFRAAFFKISFGDQVQFFRREPVVRKNLFPDIPLMEDVELSIRLNRLGKQVYLYGNAMVSARRWDQKGSKNAVLIIWLVILYLVKRLRGTPDTSELYRRYYNIKNGRHS